MCSNSYQLPKYFKRIDDGLFLRRLQGLGQEGSDHAQFKNLTKAKQQNYQRLVL